MKPIGISPLMPSTTVDLRRIPSLLVFVSLVFLPSSASGGAISGTVRSFVSGQPVEATVRLLDENGSWLHDFNAGTEGHYEFTALAAGFYHLSANGSVSLALEYWPDVICFTGSPNCDPGQLVSVSVEGTVTADFSLDTLGSVSGRVVDAETGDPVGGGMVKAAYFDGGSGYGLAGANVDTNGYYQIVGMTPGTWKLFSFGNSNHIERIFGGENCEVEFCQPWQMPGGTILNTQLNQGTAVADLALSFGPGLAGWARREGSVAAGMNIDVFDEMGGYLGTVAGEGTGRFRMALVGGTYYLATDNGPNFIDEVYRQISCPDGPARLGLCEVLAGDPLTVDPVAPATDGLLFDLASRSALFRDGFESGDPGAWSQAMP